MAVIVDDGVRKEVAQLEAAGKFSLAGQFKKANEVSLESLAFQTTVPAEYAALVENSAAFQAMRAQHDEKAKHEHEQEERDAKRAAAVYQQEIDRNVLSFDVDGHDIQISQGDLRKIMKARLEALEEQKKELQRTGRNPVELKRVDNLIAEYEPAVDDLQKHKADAATMGTVGDLMRRDGELAAQIETHSSHEIQQTNEEKTSPSAEHTSPGGSATQPLTVTFSRTASPEIQAPSAPAPQPLPEQRQQKANNTVASIGI
jgi:hypothetical protein